MEQIPTKLTTRKLSCLWWWGMLTLFLLQANCSLFAGGFSLNDKHLKKSSLKSRSTAENNDNGYSRLGRVLPVPFQNWLRDVGAAQVIMDGAATATALSLLASPQIRKLYFEISEKTQRFQYGTRPKQFLELLPFVDSSGSVLEDDSTPRPLALFVHGGAWGSGSPAFYRTLATGLGAFGFRVLLLSYRVYPEATMKEQADDLGQALTWLDENSALLDDITSQGVYIIGHSSGAHITSLYKVRNTLANQKTPANVLCYILFNGVYDIGDHYEHEASRHVHEISPMKAAAGNPENFAHNSPALIANSLTQEQASSIVPTILIHGEQDIVVPASSSILFAEVMRKAGAKVTLQCIPELDHGNGIWQLMFPDEFSIAHENEVSKILTSLNDLSQQWAENKVIVSENEHVRD